MSGLTTSLDAAQWSADKSEVFWDCNDFEEGGRELHRNVGKYLSIDKVPHPGRLHSTSTKTL
jgi:hypothetical protein